MAAFDACPLLLDRPRVDSTEARADIVNARAQELAPAEQDSKTRGSVGRGIDAIHALLKLRTGPLYGIARRIWRTLPAQIRHRLVKQWL